MLLLSCAISILSGQGLFYFNHVIAIGQALNVKSSVLKIIRTLKIMSRISRRHAFISPDTFKIFHIRLHLLILLFHKISGNPCLETPMRHDVQKHSTQIHNKVLKEYSQGENLSRTQGTECQ